VQVETGQCIGEVSDEFFIELTGLIYRELSNIIPYPNPTDGIISFSLPEQIQGILLKISILDMSGRYMLRLLDLPQATDKTSIDLSHLEPGVYTYIILNTVLLLKSMAD